MHRNFIKSIILIAFVMAMLVIFIALQRAPSAKSQEEWITLGATVAAALAVVTSVFSAWISQRIIELQEDQLRPYVYPTFDAANQRSMLQLKVSNMGRSAAHEISLKWDRPLLNLKGEPLDFHSQGRYDIAVLLPGESISLPIGLVTLYLKKYENEDLDYRGTVSFKDANETLIRYPVFLSAAKLLYLSESPRDGGSLIDLPSVRERASSGARDMRPLRQSSRPASERMDQPAL